MLSLDEMRDDDIEILNVRDGLRGLACSVCASACVVAAGELGGVQWTSIAFAAYVASISAFITGVVYGQICATETLE